MTVIENFEKTNRAAERFARVSSESYKTVVDHAVAVRERNTRFAQEIFDGVTGELRQQAESNRVLAEELIERAEKQRGAVRTLVGETVDAYMDFVYAPFGYYKEGLRLVEAEVTEGDFGFPISNYDDLNVADVSKKIDNLSAGELRKVREYEKKNKNRDTVIEQIDRKLKLAS